MYGGDPMLIWRGWGVLTVVILFGALILTQLVVDGLSGDGTYEANPYLYGGFALIVGGMATHLTGRWLDSRGRRRDLVDQATGERFVLQDRNDLFWISMRTWGLIAIVAGTAMFLIGVLDVVR
jgi:hypothetical protein